jgi:hypothetical protein
VDVALELKLHPGDGGKGARPQGSVESACLLHGLWLSISLETSKLERSVAKKGVVMCDGLSQQVGRTARDYCASPDLDYTTYHFLLPLFVFLPPYLLQLA